MRFQAILLAFVATAFGGVARAQSVEPMPLLPGQPGVDPGALGTANDDLAFWRWWMLNQDWILDLRRRLDVAIDTRQGRRRVLESDLPRVIRSLRDAQTHSSAAVRAAAALALGKSTERDGIAALIEAPGGTASPPLLDGALEVRRAAILGLGAARSEAAIPTLVEIVHNEKFEVELRAVAAIAIGAIEFVDSTPAAAAGAPKPLAPRVPSAPGVDWSEPHTLAPRAVAVTAIAIDHAEKRAALGFADGRIAIWPLDRDKVGVEWEAHSGPITGLAFSTDGERLVSASSSGTLRIRSLKAGTDGVKIEGLGGIACLALDSKDQRLALGTAEGEVVIVPMSGKKEFLERRATHAGPVAFVGFSNDNGTVASGGADGLVRAQEVTAGAKSRVISTRRLPIRIGAIARDGRYFVLGLDDGKVERFVFERSEEPTWSTVTEGGPPAALAYDEKGSVLLIVDANGRAELRSDALGEPLGEAGVRGSRGVLGGSTLVVGVDDGAAHSRRFTRAGGAAVAAGGGAGSGAGSGTGPEQRRNALSALLEEKSYFGFEPLLQDGIAIGAGLSRDRELLPLVLSAIERGRGRGKGLSAPTLGFLTTAAGRLIATDPAPSDAHLSALLALATKDDLAPVRRAAVTALGQVFEKRGNDSQVAPTVTAMIGRIERSNGESDHAVMNAIYVALGRIASEAGLGFLRHEMSGQEGSSRVLGGAPLPKIDLAQIAADLFQSMALAIGRDGAGYRMAETKFKRSGGLGQRGAFALSLGVHGPVRTTANDELLAAFKKEKSPVLQAHLALAFGLGGVLDAKTRLLERLADPKVDVSVIPQLAIGAALLEVPPNREIPNFLVKQFSAAKSPPRGAAFAFALGLLGDVHSVECLLASLQDPKLPIDVRVACVNALGMMLDPSTQTTLARMRADLDSVNEPRLLAALGVFEIY